ncbi:MAG: hypothetical protein J6V90_08170 [Treponema sp.]|nr:hypothetical protein [Treponema sp.]
MEVVYKIGSKTFYDKEEAKIYEGLPWEKTEILVKEEVKLIPPSKLKDVFDCDKSVTNMFFYIRDKEYGSVEEDGGYETNGLDETGHLHCTDLSHGLLEWSEKEQTYYRIVHGRSWKVELLGISDVSYW